MIRTGNFHFVRWAEIPSFERRGWMVVQADLGPTHGWWSVLMWRCDCPEPATALETRPQTEEA